MKKEKDKTHPEKRDRVIVTKVTQTELAQVMDTAEKCGMTRSGFVRARILGYRPKLRLTCQEKDGLRQLAAGRTDMVNFANALHGLTDDEKIRLFRHQPTMLEWYGKVADVTNRVTAYLKSVQSPNRFLPRTTEDWVADNNGKEDAV